MANKQQSASLAFVAMAMAVVLLAGEAMATRPPPQQAQAPAPAPVQVVEARVNNNNIQNGVGVNVGAEENQKEMVNEVRGHIEEVVAWLNEMINKAKSAKAKAKNSVVVAACDKAINAMVPTQKLYSGLIDSYSNPTDAAKAFDNVNGGLSSDEVEKAFNTCIGAEPPSSSN